MYEPGTIIDDTWVVEAVLGAGAMGSVCRCHNRHAPRIKAAIKVLGRNLTNLPEAQKRFVREAEVLFGLDHPHIVKVRNVRLDATPPYIEMEFVEGASLESLVQRGPLPLPQALVFAAQLAGAIRYLHRNGICHRDIKPANMLVRKGAVLTLVDFGLATEQAGDRITAAGSAFGTVSYAPPEWVRPAELDPEQWDRYALGVVLYEMLTGAVGFPVPGGAGQRQAALQVMSDKQRLPYLDPGEAFPDEVRELVRDLTARDPADRPPSSRQVVRRIQRVQQGLEVDAATMLAEHLDPEEFRAQVEASVAAQPSQDSQPAGPAAPAAELPALTDVLTGPVDRPTTWLGLLALGGGGGLVVLVGLLGLVGLVGAWWWLTGGGDSQLVPRAVRVELSGLPDELPVSIHVDGRAPVEVEPDGGRLFAPAEPGPVDLSWAIGDGCDGAGCPGTSCPGWCVTGSRTQIVEPGNGPATLHVELSAPAERPVQITVPGASDRRIEARAGDRAAPVVDGRATLSLPPGRYALEVASPSCPDEALGCGASGSCPEGCVSVTATLDVPRTGPSLLTVPLPPPPEPEPAPTRRPARTQPTSGPLVSQRAFGAWLASHPEWSRNAAIGSGRADPNYLKTFDPDAPTDAPVVEVSWSAAAAFCASRGGLADLAAPPTTWGEDAGPFHEWRIDGDRPSWRRYDGETSHQLARAHSNAFTGFRCARGR